MLLNQMLDGRINRFLRSMFLDEQAGVETLAPELQAVFVAEEARLEHRLLKGERSYWGVGGGLSGVGTRVFLQMLNPLESNQIHIIESILLESATAQQIDLLVGIDAPIGALVTDKAAVDRRPQNEPLTNRSSLQIRSLVAAAGVGNLFGSLRVAANIPLVLEPRRGIMVLGPGRALTVQSTIDSATLRVNALWTERGVRPSELG